MSELAGKILRDIRTLSAFEPREDEIRGLEHAYHLQSEVNAALLSDRPGRVVAGYKIAFNRRSSMEYYGLSEPCYAPLFSDQMHESGASLKLADFRDLVIEPEIGVRLRRRLSGGETRKEAEAAVAALFPAIEIMDARGAFARDPSAAAAVAQRVHSEGAVVGPGVSVADFDTAAALVRMSVDGIVVGEATGAAPQAPVEAVSWLAERLAKDGLPLDADMIVLTGAHLPGRKIDSTGLIDVSFNALGRVALNIT